MVTILLGTYNIKSYRNEKKQLFLGTLCNMKYSDLTNRIFVKRLFHFYTAITENNYGCLKDVNAILQTYELSNSLDMYRSTGHFPTYSQWKRVVREHVRREKSTPSGARAPHLMNSSASGLYTTVRSQPTAGAWRSSVQTVFR